MIKRVYTIINKWCEYQKALNPAILCNGLGSFTLFFLNKGVAKVNATTIKITMTAPVIPSIPFKNHQQFVFVFNYTSLSLMIVDLSLVSLLLLVPELSWEHIKDKYCNHGTKMGFLIASSKPVYRPKNKRQKKPLQIFDRLYFSLNFSIMANIRCGIGIT